MEEISQLKFPRQCYFIGSTVQKKFRIKTWSTWKMYNNIKSENFDSHLSINYLQDYFFIFTFIISVLKLSDGHMAVLAEGNAI